MPYEPIVPDGQHLGTSRTVDGAYTGHLFDDGTNGLKGHAAWRWVDEPDDEHGSEDHDYSSIYEDEPPRKLTQEELEQAAQLAFLIGAFLAGIAVEAKPHVERWWNEKAVPSAKTVWVRVKSLHKRKKPASRITPASDTSTFIVSPSGVEVAIADSRVTMSGAEWADRFQAMLAAGRFRDEQLRILSSARIEDGLGLDETRTEQLTPRQFVDRIMRTLEANPSLLEEETSAELVRLFSAQRGPSRQLGTRESSS